MQEVKIVLEGGVLPKKATKGAACYDLFAPEDFKLEHGRQVLPLGFRMQLPKNMAAIVKSRSGFSSKGIEVMYEQLCELYKKRLAADVLLGTIDSDYTGVVGVIIDVHNELCHTRSSQREHVLHKCRLSKFLKQSSSKLILLMKQSVVMVALVIRVQRRLLNRVRSQSEKLADHVKSRFLWIRLSVILRLN